MSNEKQWQLEPIDVEEHDVSFMLSPATMHCEAFLLVVMNVKWRRSAPAWREACRAHIQAASFGHHN